MSEKLRISKDGKEIKILGGWYCYKDLCASVQLFQRAQSLIGLSSEATKC